MKAMTFLLYSAFFAITVMQCKPTSSEPENLEQTPVIQGIADEQAAKLIEATELAMGGRHAYEEVEVLRWTFFGRRHLVWNKHSGDVRIDSPGDSTTYLINVKDNTGRVRIGSEEITVADSLQTLIEKGKSIWINDSYWLVMPWKLRDPGVTASYVGVDTTQTGASAKVLALTFDQVGLTPQNKYHVWITDEDALVKQWSFYPNATDEAPRATWAWDNYQTVSKEPKVILSFDRSDKTGPSRVAARQGIPAAVFKEFDAEAALQEAFSEI